ncbi:hypothetical protein [Chroococcus sp. FPU101]|uniref:hypothetical protein n=1 Tax=Chroococcus sp. FPU101 TaxID=1974212 RepID=UPI001A8C241A|nr:hypothetical protein [Chroococcus sp. FPU101]GFE70604.1 hypothetical protein CFPU101_32140 [Chroococcus sp. FPU101]
MSEDVGNQEQQIAFAIEVQSVNRLIKSWETKLPAWTEMIKELRVLSKDQMQDLFLEASIYIEHKFLLEKSYSFYKPYTKS